MLTINPNEEKTIHFVVEINGVGCDEMNGHVRFALEGVEYGFPVSFEGDEIVATIKPLNELFEGKLKNGMLLDARLDLASPNHNYYFNPWSDEIQVKMPVSVEARIVDGNGGTRGASVKAKVMTEKKVGGRAKQESLLERKQMIREQLKNVTEKDIIKYMEKAGTKTRRIQKIILEQASAGAKSNLDVLKNVVKILKKNK